ncbi:hypothetical protein [Roseomonas sp. BN140053]
MEPDALGAGLLLGYYRHIQNPTPEQQARLADLERQHAERKGEGKDGQS